MKNGGNQTVSDRYGVEIQWKPKQKVEHFKGWKLSQQTSQVDGVHLEIVHADAWKVPVLRHCKARAVDLVIDDPLRKGS